MKNKLLELLDFMMYNRRTGSTTLIKEVVEKNPNVFVLFNGPVDSKELGCKKDVLLDIAVLYGTLSPKNWHGKKPRPILIDNHAFEIVVRDAIKQIEDGEEIIEKLKGDRDELELQQKALRRDIEGWKQLNTDKSGKIWELKWLLEKYVHHTIKDLDANEGQTYSLATLDTEKFNEEEIKLLQSYVDSYNSMK